MIRIKDLHRKAMECMDRAYMEHKHWSIHSAISCCEDALFFECTSLGIAEHGAVLFNDINVSVDILKKSVDNITEYLELLKQGISFNEARARFNQKEEKK